MHPSRVAKTLLAIAILATALFYPITPSAQENYAELIKISFPWQGITNDEYVDAGYADGSWYYISWYIYSKRFWYDAADLFYFFLYNHETNQAKMYRLILWDSNQRYYTRFTYTKLITSSNIITFRDTGSNIENVAIIKNGSITPLFNIDLNQYAPQWTDNYNIPFYRFDVHGDRLYIAIMFRYIRCFEYCFSPGDCDIFCDPDYKLVLAKAPLNPIDSTISIDAVEIEYKFIVEDYYIRPYGERSFNKLIAVWGNYIYIVSPAEPYLLIVDAETLAPIKLTNHYCPFNHVTLHASDSGVYVACYQREGNEFYVTKFDHNGNLLWSKRYTPSPSSYYIYEVDVVARGDYLYVGFAISYIASVSVIGVAVLDANTGNLLNHFNVAPTVYYDYYSSVNAYTDNSNVYFTYAWRVWEADYNDYLIYGVLKIPGYNANITVPSHYKYSIIEYTNSASTYTMSPPQYNRSSITLMPPDNVELEEIEYIPYFGITVERMLLKPGTGPVIMYIPLTPTITHTPPTTTPITPTTPKPTPRVNFTIPTLPPALLPQPAPVYTTVPPGIGSPDIGSPEGVLIMGLPLVLFVFLSMRLRWTQSLFIASIVTTVMSITIFDNPTLFAFSLILTLSGLILDKYI